VAAGIGDLVATLVADTKQWQSGLATAKTGLASFARTAATSLAGVAASFATVNFGMTAIDAAESHIAAMKKLDAVFSATGGAAGLSAQQIDEYATALQRVTNFDGDVTIGAAAILATFREIKGDTFKQALSLMQDMSTVMGTDLNAAAVQVGKALNNPIEGLTALRRVGVSFTEQQKEQIKAMQAVGDIAGAQKLILGELGDEFGGASRAAATATQQIRFLLGDLTEQIGNDLLPAVELFAETMGPSLQKSVDGMNELTLASKEFDESMLGILATAKE
jgi:hypothetical protein